MSALMERARKSGPTKSKSAGTVIAGLPQVNLLPPEVRAARGLRSIKRWLVIALLATLVVCGLLYMVNVAASRSADDALLDAQAETARLTVEQGKYAEVPRVQQQLATTETARTQSMSTDVEWKSYLDAITAVLPEGVSVDILAMNAATPMAPLGASGNMAVASPRVGEIQLTARSMTLPDTAKMIDALNSVPGLGDAWVSAAVVTSDPDHGVYYKIDGTVEVLDAALSHRFDATTDSDGGK